MFPKKRGTPKWMVYNGKPYEQMDDLGEKALFLETPTLETSPGKFGDMSKWGNMFNSRSFDTISMVISFKH